jgi:hypothetical protein
LIVANDGCRRRRLRPDLPLPVGGACRAAPAHGARQARAQRRRLDHRNGQLDPGWAKAERSTLGIVGRAISTMIAASGFNDVIRICATTRRDRIGCRLACIGSDFEMELPSPFHPPSMKALYGCGCQKAVRGCDWAKAPPGME